MEVTSILCDNQSCIKLSKNPVFHDRSNHIDIRCHFIRDWVQRGIVQLQYTLTGEQVANILTKALGKTKFVYFREKMGMMQNPFQQQEWRIHNSEGAVVQMQQVTVAVAKVEVQGATAQQMGASRILRSATQSMLQNQSSLQQAYCWNTFLAKREC